MFKFDLDTPWSQFLNQNLKWSTGVVLRCGTILLLVLCTWYGLKAIGVPEYFSSADSQVKNVETVEIINDSQPSKISYQEDITRITELKKRLEKYTKQK